MSLFLFGEKERERERERERARGEGDGEIEIEIEIERQRQRDRATQRDRQLLYFYTHSSTKGHMGVKPKVFPPQEKFSFTVYVIFSLFMIGEVWKMEMNESRSQKLGSLWPEVLKLDGTVSNYL